MTEEAQGRRRIKLVTAAIALQVLLSALDTTIIGTAMPTVVAALGGLNMYSWAFASYMLATMVATPIAGKLCDVYGRRRIFLIGIWIFLAASWLCGLYLEAETRLRSNFGELKAGRGASVCF